MAAMRVRLLTVAALAWACATEMDPEVTYPDGPRSPTTDARPNRPVDDGGGVVPSMDATPPDAAPPDAAPPDAAPLDAAPRRDQGDLGDAAPPVDAAPDAAPSVDAAQDAAPPIDAALDAAPPVDAALDAAPPVDAAPRADAAPVADAAPDQGAPPPRRPSVILFVGAGMGPGHVAAASRAATGAPDRLRFQALPQVAFLRTSSLSGITDAAAAATAMATGRPTLNAHLGVDRAAMPQTNLAERARVRGWRTGLITSGALTDPGLAAWALHTADALTGERVANDLTRLGPDVLLGGGARAFRPMGPDSDRGDEGLLDPLRAAGYTLVESAAALAAARPDADGRLVGLFAGDALAPPGARPATQPTLAAMVEAALLHLDAGGRGGFVLVVRAEHVGRAAAARDLKGVVDAVSALDAAFDAARAWADDREDVTLIVTGDREIGGLEVVGGGGGGALPDVTWSAEAETNRRVTVWARGPGADTFDGSESSLIRLHDVLRAPLEGGAVRPPSSALVPDGHLADLRWLATAQTNPAGFGAGFNELDALRLDVDPHTLALGLEGRFERAHNAIVVLVDVDPGAGTGVGSLRGALSDRDGLADAVLTATPVTAPPVDGFGADLAVVLALGAEPRLEQLVPDGGLRGLSGRFGRPDDLAWLPAAVAVHERARADTDRAAAGGADIGLEVHLPLSALYPERADALTPVPPDAVIDVAAFLVNDDGSFLSNHALPPFADMPENPGAAATPLPGVVRFELDTDGDGRPDGAAAPQVLP